MTQSADEAIFHLLPVFGGYQGLAVPKFDQLRFHAHVLLEAQSVYVCVSSYEAVAVKH